MRSFELALAAPAVIAHRSSRMLAAGATPGPADRREFTRMGREKVDACLAGYFAMFGQAQRLQLEWWLALARACWAPWTGRGGFARGFSAGNLSRRMSRSALDVFASGLVPLHRTATANARRLGRHRSR